MLWWYFCVRRTSHDGWYTSSSQRWIRKKHRQWTLLLYMHYSYKNLFSLDIWTVGFPEISVNFLTLTQFAAFYLEHHTSLKLSHPWSIEYDTSLKCVVTSLPPHFPLYAFTVKISVFTITVSPYEIVFIQKHHHNKNLLHDTDFELHHLNVESLL